MAIAWDEVSKVVVAGGGAVAALARVLSGRGARSNRRDQLKQDIEILLLLPEESEGKAKLREHIDVSIGRLIEDEDERRRDPFGMTLGVIFVGLAVWTASFALGDDGSPLWWLLAIPLGVLGLGGFAQDATRKKRDERGRIIRE